MAIELTTTTEAIKQAIREELGVIGNSGTTLINVIIKDYTETHYNIGNTTTGVVLDLSSGTFQTATLNDNCLFTMPSITAGKSFNLLLSQDISGAHTATFSGVKWPANTAPTITTGAFKMDILTFVADTGNWYGSIIQDYNPS